MDACLVKPLSQRMLADALARALGIPDDDPARIDAGIVHALREAGVPALLWAPYIHIGP